MFHRFICPHCHHSVAPSAMESATGPSGYYRICPVCDEAVLVALASALHAGEPLPDDPASVEPATTECAD